MTKKIVKWYKKGNFYKDEIEIEQEAMFHIVRYRYNDKLSTDGYRYWIYTSNDKEIFTLVDRTNFRMKYVTMYAEPVNIYEFEAIKNNVIILSDYSSTGGFFFKDFLKFYSESCVAF